MPYTMTEQDKIVTAEYKQAKQELLAQLEASHSGDEMFPWDVSVQISPELEAHPFYVKNLRGAELKWLIARKLKGTAEVLTRTDGRGQVEVYFQVTVEGPYVKK